ncbi:cytoskeletal protein-binding protein SLA1 NDAI_0A03330 [Naumovozyma dairenensis CBS 421]|uniref:Actin cytoskeleton-regulatory complex protein SLA1 n=1 Tax=Naumovozyma dairenensis (strain ATCC 10597 / BCRC 20456 / CBS 421 / NBRC 0211 / NRRL Y-12639) TaxID=1071378 RepID=G0W3V2_NAUDC|nr:hypothetical protein NDAI_0A03330 [Naumovozyma dairenensis CBS 421]CCD22490.1 hypothetical protein NDAI_0A03330 [Naumovozyma dairenensis CBS 421]
MTAFLGVYKAIYDYEPQTPEELELKENDLLYLLEKSEVDDWWTVKKRVIGSDAEEPVGLVPSNYIEEAPVIAQVKALYDYEQIQNPEEELIFHENDLFSVYDDKDPDWLLVKSQISNEVGFVPGNYVQPVSATAAPQGMPAATPTTATTNVDASTFLPPPQRVDRVKVETESQPEREGEETSRRETSTQNYKDGEEEEEAPPEKPARPVSTGPIESTREKSRNRMSYYDDDGYAVDDYHRDDDRRREQNNDREREDRYNNEANDYSPEPQSWKVTEIEGRKKHKAKLIIGHNRINFIPNKGDPQEWTIDKLVSYDNEKKHMFLEFIDPYKNLELHTGNNDTCNEIMAVIGEIKGASRDPGLREVQMAAKSKKQARVLVDFIAESNDELTVKEGDMVYILNDKKSKDWWMCELVKTGEKGVVPAQFIEPPQEKSSSGGLFSSLKRITRGSMSKSPSKAPSSTGLADWKNDADQSLSPKKSRNRGSSFSTRRKRSSSTSNVNKERTKEFPNPKKTRLWVDRSGTFKVEAQFIGCAEGKIHLHKANGVKIAVAASKLSDDDLLYVERVTGFSLDKFKEKKPTSTDARESERERRRMLREQEERERDRRLREQELYELKKARELLAQDRERLQQDKELPPIKPPRPQSSISVNDAHDSSRVNRSSSRSDKKKGSNYDWFEFFLNTGVDVNNCQRYTINFDREQITEDMMQDINSSMLRTLGLREGDIVRVMKYLDKKFGRETETQRAAATGSIFTEADGSLKVNTVNTAGQPALLSVPQQQLMPQATAPPAAVSHDDDAWTVQPAAKSQPNLVNAKAEFTGSMQDLLDLQPLEPKKATPATPEPKLEQLEPVKTGTESNTAQIATNVTGGPALASNVTGGRTLVPLDPFKTGGNNVLPISSGFVMMPFTTGGLMTMPQTSFGMQPTGTILPVQKTGGGLIPIATTGGAMPQTSFGLLPLSTTGGASIIPQTTFGAPPLGSILPVQKTANGVIATNSTGGMMPMQTTGGILPTTTFMNPAFTGGAIPQTSFGTQIMGNTLQQTSLGGQVTGGAMPQTSFGNQLTGGVSGLPQTSFVGTQSTGNLMTQQRTGGFATLPQTTFGAQITGGFQPQSQFGLTLQRTGGASFLPQNQFTGGPQMMNTGGVFQQSQPMNTFNTGGAMQLPNTNGITQGMQNTFISQPSQQIPLQTQPTGFGFGNGPQQTAQSSQMPQSQQPRQANLFNATADNPFGF